MVRGFWTVMAAGLVLAVTVLSMCMNFKFGYGLGTSEGTRRMLGALSVAFDGPKALLPLFIAWQWRDSRCSSCASAGRAARPIRSSARSPARRGSTSSAFAPA
jgi:hypothetical protein